MNKEAIQKVENTVFLLVEQWINVSLRRNYLGELVGKDFVAETSLPEIDAIIGLQNILLIDFFHSIGSLAFERDKSALSVIGTFERVNNKFAENYLREKWSNLEHNVIPTGPDLDVSIFHSPLRERDIAAFERLYSEVVALGNHIFTNDKFMTLKSARDKITAHREYSSVNGQVRMLSFQDLQANIQNAFDLFEELDTLVLKLYLLLTNGFYRTTNVLNHQKAMAKCLAAMLPFKS